MSALVSLVRTLLAYDIWANRQYVVGLSEVEESHLLLDSGSEHGSVLGTLAHLLGMERLWLTLFLGGAPEGVAGLEEYPDLPALAAGFQELWPELEFFLASLNQELLESHLAWQGSDGEVRELPLGQLVVQMVHGSSFLRGQTTALVRQLGHEPPRAELLDYLVGQR